MLERSQNATLVQEAGHQPCLTALNQLERNALLELAVVTFSEVDRAHAAAAENSDDPEITHAFRRAGRAQQVICIEQRCGELQCRSIEEAG